MAGSLLGTGSLAASRTGPWLFASIVLALVLVLMLPLTPWWFAMDCDVSYVGSALNMIAGKPNEFLYHPGMLLHSMLTVALELHQSAASMTNGISVEGYVDSVFQAPGQVFGIVRGLAVAYFLFAAGCVFIVGKRAGGHPAWGMFSAVVYFATIGHLPRAVMYRPETVLAGLSLIIVAVAICAWQKRVPLLWLFAVALFSFAMTVKIHALGLAPVLFISGAALVREDWIKPIQGAAVAVNRHRVLALLCTVLWMLLVAVGNRHRPWPEVDLRVLAVLTVILAWAAVSWFVWRLRSRDRESRRQIQGDVGVVESGRFAQAPDGIGTRSACGWSRTSAQTEVADPDFIGVRGSRFLTIVFFPLVPFALVAAVIGFVVPNLMLADQLVPLARQMYYSLSGQGINEGVQAGSFLAAAWAQWQDPRLYWQLPIIVGGLVASIGLVRRGEWHQSLWMLAAACMFVLAAMRATQHGSPHHYGPVSLLCIPLIVRWLAGAPLTGSSPWRWLWIRRSCLAGLLVVSSGIIVGVLRDTRDNQARCQVIDAMASGVAGELLPDEFVLTDFWAQTPDAGMFMLMRGFSNYKPERVYRFLPDSPPAMRYANVHAMSPSFYLTSGGRMTREVRAADGSLEVHNAWGFAWPVERVAQRLGGKSTLTLYRVVGRPTPRE